MKGTDRSGALALSLMLMGVISAQGIEVTWNNSTGDRDYINPANWDLGFPVSESMNINLGGADRAIMGAGISPNADAIRIGIVGGANGEFEQSGGELTAVANSSAYSRIGANGGTGTWTMSGGEARINMIALGLGNVPGTSGTLDIRGGDMVIGRGHNDYSLSINGNGSSNSEADVIISGGSLVTRLGVNVRNNGTFSVVGSGAAQIGVGSLEYANNPIDGRWVQEGGGMLSLRVDDTAQGLTKIFINDTTSTDWNGDVTFAAGSLLDVDFAGAYVNEGTFTVMEWEGAVLENKLAFAPGVDTSIWSMNVDEVNKVLTVTAIPEPMSVILVLGSLGSIVFLRRLFCP